MIRKLCWCKKVKYTALTSSITFLKITNNPTGRHFNFTRLPHQNRETASDSINWLEPDDNKVSHQRGGDERPPTSKTSCPARADPPLHLHPPSFLTRLFPPDLQLLPLYHLAVISSQRHRWLEKAGGGQIGKFFSAPSPYVPVYHHRRRPTSANPTEMWQYPRSLSHSQPSTTQHPRFPRRRRKILRALPLHLRPLQGCTQI